MRMRRESSAHVPSSHQLTGRGRTAVALSHLGDNKAYYRLLRRLRDTETHGRPGVCEKRPDPACGQGILEILKEGLGRITGQKSSTEVSSSSTWTSPPVGALSSSDPTKSRGDNTACRHSDCNDTGMTRSSTQLIPTTPAAGGHVVVRYIASWFDACCIRPSTRSSLLAMPPTDDVTSTKSTSHPGRHSNRAAKNSLKKTRTNAGDSRNSTNSRSSARNTSISPKIHPTPAGILLTSDGAKTGTERRRVMERGVRFADSVVINGSEKDVSQVDDGTGKKGDRSAGGGVGTSESSSTTWQEALGTFTEDPKYRYAPFSAFRLPKK